MSQSKQGKASKSYEYFSKKGEELGVDYHVVSYVYNLYKGTPHCSTQEEAVAYVSSRLEKPRGKRGDQPKWFLEEVQAFLGSASPETIDKIFINPADSEPLFEKLFRMVQVIVDMPDREQHILGFTGSLLALAKKYKDNDDYQVWAHPGKNKCRLYKERLEARKAKPQE